MNVIVLDTETTNTIDDPIAYDIGWAVVNLGTGAILERRSYAIKEVFLDEELMALAYFADKIPEYWAEIERGGRELVTRNEARKQLRRDCKTYEVTEIYAFNVRFDYLSLNLTQRYLTCSKYRYFTPYGIQFMDILKYARCTLKDNAEYRNFCLENNYLTKNGGNRYTAEIVYRFLTNNNSFNEEHKGIDDVMIEKYILLYCKKHLPNFDARLW